MNLRGNDRIGLDFEEIYKGLPSCVPSLLKFDLRNILFE